MEGGSDIKGSSPEWCISSMIYSRDTPSWSGTHDMYMYSKTEYRRPDSQLQAQPQELSCSRVLLLLLILRSPAISLGFTILGEIFAYATIS